LGTKLRTKCRFFAAQNNTMGLVFFIFSLIISNLNNKNDQGCAGIIKRQSDTYFQDQDPDEAIFLQKQSLLRQFTGQTRARQCLHLAESFLGTPYKTGALDIHTEEQLTINFRVLDCWTLVEKCLALSMAGPDATYDQYKKQLQQLRYWGGEINGYASRHHYFTGWILQAEKLNILNDVTRDFNGIPYRKKFSFITDNPAKYPKLRDDATAKAILAAEGRINRHPWFFIPKNKVASKEGLIKEGDIIVLCSSRRNLDVAHQGFAVLKNGRVHLLHASSLKKRVIVSAEPLPQYMAKQRGQSGIMVIRLAEPNKGQ
jgi:hypothetical protein